MDLWERVNVLLVDDRPEQLIALEAALDDPDVNLVKASSGQEALRRLLKQDFAVILLDVNMPGMDGYETAALIRRRQRSAHTPIIFVTAMSDTDTSTSRGYSVGAVDYMYAPLAPDVLKAKVGVFAELFRRGERDRQQADRRKQLLEQEQKLTLRLRQLTAASVLINAAPTVEAILQATAEQAREIAGARQALARIKAEHKEQMNLGAVSVSGASLAGTTPASHSFESPLFERALEIDQRLRLTEAELESHPLLAGSPAEDTHGLKPRGWLSVPLTGRDGRHLGFIQLSDRVSGEFDDDDEVLIDRLAEIASNAIENILYRDAREANRLKDEFLAVLSHELRTPLNAMLGWTQMLRRGDLGPADTARALEIIERNVKVQAQLIEDLLDVSRIITGKVRLNISSVKAAPVVEAALDAVRPSLETKGIELEMALDSSACVTADPDRLQQVVWNLLSNAIKFTPREGRITVAIGRHGNDDVEMAVSDTGEGIRPDLLPHVFDRFRQGDSGGTRAHGGLGLGLTIVRHLVELHGGTVHAQSSGIGQGATFVVRLPMVEAGAEISCGSPVESVDVPSGTTASEARLDGVRVLVVDDEPDTLTLVAAALSGHGAEVTVAESSRQALEAIDRVPPDVIVSDISMPGEDGYAFVRKVRERPPELGGAVPAMALTASVRGEDRVHALSAGFQMHMPKPIELSELVRAVTVLAGSRTARAGGQLDEGCSKGDEAREDG